MTNWTVDREAAFAWSRWRPSRRRRGWRPSISLCCISWDRRHGRTRPCWHGFATGFFHGSSSMDRSGRGSSTTRASQEGQALGGRSASASCASRTTVRLRLAYRSPMMQPRFRSPTNCISRSAGRRIRNNARRPRFLQKNHVANQAADRA